jgi:hypothetical protein
MIRQTTSIQLQLLINYLTNTWLNNRLTWILSSVQEPAGKSADLIHQLCL